MSANAERAQDLIVDYVTEGLDSIQERELRELLPRCPGLDVESFELAAAAVELACMDEVHEPMPHQLKLRLVEQSRRQFAEPSPADKPGRIVNFPETVADTPAPAGSTTRSDTGWWVAAACFLLAVLGWWPRIFGPADVEKTPGTVARQETTSVAVPAMLPPARAREQLISQADDLIRIDWTPTEDPYAQNAAGDVVWSTHEQRGFMRFKGLPANNSREEQYQLWIFDANQDERYPVDGGVFSIGPDGEAIIEIRAKLKITGPTLFAITVEKPGGVVVSDRERLPLVASVG